MKNLSLILSIILLVAVGVLYYLHFASPKAVAAATQGASNVPTDAKIAYIKSDSVLKHYDYLETRRKVFEEKGKKLEQELRNRAQGLQNEIKNYQNSVNNLTFTQQKALEEDLGKKQQNLQMYQQGLEQQLAQDEALLMKDLYDRITAYLKKYSVENGLQVVLKYDPTSDVLYGGETLDITNDVIKGLNDEYQAEKTATPAAESVKEKK